MKHLTLILFVTFMAPCPDIPWRAAPPVKPHAAAAPAEKETP
jgi:hypothetical protein